MKLLQEMYETALLKAFAEKCPPEADLESVSAAALERALPGIVRGLEQQFKKDAPRMLRDQRKLDAGFRRRNHRRWAKPIDLLEMMWVIAHEAAEEFDSENRPDAAKAEDYEFEALTHIHARALLVTREIICLLEGGFPDGALSRWRTLHELAVTALFLRDHDQELSERYLASFDFRAFRSAQRINQYSGRGEPESVPRKDLDLLKRRCAALESRLGSEMRNEYGWAAPTLGKQRPNFVDIEKAVKLEHWRPRYGWASHHNHAGHRPAANMLGTSETTGYMFLVGQSNSGFVDPIQMTALALTQVTSALLLSKTSLDNVVIVTVLHDFSTEIGPLALKVEQQTLTAARALQEQSRPS